MNVFLARLRGYQWDRDKGQYISKWNNRYVKETTVLKWAEKYQGVVEQNLEVIANKFIDGKISLSTFQTSMAKEIKDGWIVSGVIGRGGRAQMTSADWGRIGAHLRNEYQFLNGFALDIKAGEQSVKQIIHRTKRYANGVRTSYYAGLTSAKEESILSEERRLLDPGAEHCDDCIAYAEIGWVPISTLPEPGDRCQCNRNCRCEKEYK
jgi:hypothetical protein